MNRLAKFRTPWLNCLVLIVGAIYCQSGCVPHQAVRRDVFPPFNYQFIRNIAVVQFSEYSARSGSGRILSDRVEQFLLRYSPYKVVTRTEINQLLSEQGLSMSGFLSQETIKRVGRILGVDAIVTGNVENSSVETTSFEDLSYDPIGKKLVPITRTKRTATVAVTWKVINTASGEVVYSNTSQGTSEQVQNIFQQPKSEYDLLNEAIGKLMDDFWWLFPHQRTVQE